MSKAEKLISDCTRNCSNEIFSPYPQIINDVRKIGGEPAKEFSPWLTPDQARKAVEIAREEIYEWLQNVSFDDYKVADEESYRMGCPYDYIDANGLINDLKNCLKK